MIVEGAGGLVGQEQQRVVDQRTGNRDTLLFALAELVGQAVQLIADTELLEVANEALFILGYPRQALG